MSKIKIIIADDQESIHEDLRLTLDSIEFEYEVIKDFYQTISIVRYLGTTKTENDIPDILLLDHDFGGNGANGLDILPKLRELQPNLPILILTGYEDDIFDDAREKYNVGYIQKPVKATDLRWNIKSLMSSMAKLEKLQQDIIENNELMDYLEGVNQSLSNTIEIEREKYVEQAIPIQMQELIQSVFPDVEFKAKAFRFLVSKRFRFNTSEWMRMFRTMKMIDWKNEGNAHAGMKIQDFKEAERMGYKKVKEYRFSQPGRIFAQWREGNKPLILLIDPEHEYDGISSF